LSSDIWPALSSAAADAIILREFRPAEIGAPMGVGHALMVRVRDVDAHCRHATEYGAKITTEPATYPYGERQYSVEDFAGYSWIFSQSVADIDPEEWGRTIE